MREVISPEECAEIIATMEPLLGEARTHNTTNPIKNFVRRRSQVAWITNGSPLDHLVVRILGTVHSAALQHFDVNLVNFEPPQFARYKALNRYGTHKDVGVCGPDRIISAVVELSNPANYVGGGLEVDADGPSDVNLLQGDVVVFPSLLNHAAKTVWAGTRYSLTIWGSCRA
jgi:predicted 2-oxoglutarate/Fe(II)-dependent dioxygenase YbiX